MRHSNIVRSPPHSPDALTVHVSKTKALAYTTLGVLFTVGSLLAVIIPAKLESALPGGSYFMVLGVALFGVVAARGVMELVSSRPMLTVNHEGVSVDPVMMGDYVVPWSQIRAFEVRRTFVQSILYIILEDPGPLIEHQTPLQRGLCRIVHPTLRKSGMLVVADAMLPVSVAEVVSCIRTRFGDEIARHRILIA